MVTGQRNITRFDIGDGLRLQKISVIKNLNRIINGISDNKNDPSLSGFKHMLEYDNGGYNND